MLKTNITKKILITGWLFNFAFASNYGYNIYLQFKLNKNGKENMAKRYNKIVSDILGIVTKSGNVENQCHFDLNGNDININCNKLVKKTIPNINNYINQNVYNQQDLLKYEIIRTDQELLPKIQRKSENFFNKFKNFIKEEYHKFKN